MIPQGVYYISYNNTMVYLQLCYMFRLLGFLANLTYNSGLYFFEGFFQKLLNSQRNFFKRPSFDGSRARFN